MLKDQVDGPHPNKKGTQSSESHHQATSAYQRVIPGHYNPLEKFSNINKLDKYYFIKIKTSVNRVDSNVIVSAMEARAGHRLVEF